jgi:type II secretory pathway pseudopilin PulG
MNLYSNFIHRSTKAMAGRFRSAISDSLGLTLMETVIALAMFSSAGTAVLLGVGAAHTSSDRVNASAVAENLARNQMEYVLSQTYVAPPGNYSSVADDVTLNLNIPTGFAVTAAAQTYVADDGYSGSIEKVVVTITRDGQSILVLESLRSGP